MPPHGKERSKPPRPAKTRPRASARPGLKVWGFRLGALLLPLLLLFGVLEGGLRLAGYGYPTQFLLPFDQGGKAVWIPNLRFGWRFFGPEKARQPVSWAIPRSKPPGTVRIFVFGESAAYGDPQPEFGLPRMLEALLTLRYPGTGFEVINGAMTGINSHVVLPIARDCVRAEGDIWVIYMGNNEVVGPYGAGTVFGAQVPPLSLVRGSLVIRETRIGQLMERVLHRWSEGFDDDAEWGGMPMFLEHTVRAEDPHMTAVYRHFERNLRDILRLGVASGAGLVVSTVAVNLRDCAPFASPGRLTSGESVKSAQDNLRRQGLEAQQAGRHEEALRLFQEAEQMDETVADLQFLMARSCLALGRSAEARRRFALARDLDGLRFRCDSRLNALTRQVVSETRRGRILLADAEAVFARESPAGVPGAEWFYEHVHLTFEGNYMLARTVADQVVELLPLAMRRGVDASDPWPTAEDCARRLLWTDGDRLAALENMLGRLGDPPFTEQINHDEQLRGLMAQAEGLRAPAQQVLTRVRAIGEAALREAPGDPVLLAHWSELLAQSGDRSGALAAARRAVALLPNSAMGWYKLGELLAQGADYGEAVNAFQQAFRLDPANLWALQGVAQAYAKLGRNEDAKRTYRRVIELKPRFGIAYMGLGHLLEAEGRTEEAERQYRLALENPIHRPSELAALADLCWERGWLAEAVSHYEAAIELSPFDPLLRVRAGQCHSALGEQEEALRHYGVAARLAPDKVEARYLLGVAYGRAGRATEAEEQFRASVELRPDLLEARLNLAMALAQQGRRSEALVECREVLRRSPTNAVALRQIEQLESTAPR